MGEISITHHQSITFNPHKNHPLNHHEILGYHHEKNPSSPPQTPQHLPLTCVTFSEIGSC